MLRFLVLRHYIVWHYTTGLSDLFHVWFNYIWYVGYLFSVKDVLFTLLSPWRRLNEKTPNPLSDLAAFGSALTVNILMRIVGLVIRSALLLSALIAFLLIMICFTTAFVFWIFAPVILLHLVVSGVSLLLF